MGHFAFANISKGDWLMAVLLWAAGLFYIIFPDAARALSQYVYSVRRARWMSGDLRDFDPYASRTVNRPPSFYRGTGIFIIVMSFLLLYIFSAYSVG